MSWSQFAHQLPTVTEAAQPGAIDRIVVDAPKGADVRNVQELQGRLRAAGGSLIVGANSSDYIVAINNNTRFSITRQPNGQFLIRESYMFPLLIGAVAIVGLILLGRAR